MAVRENIKSWKFTHKFTTWIPPLNQKWNYGLFPLSITFSRTKARRRSVKKYPKKFDKIHMNTHVLESFFNKVAGQTFQLRMRFWCRYFLENFTKYAEQLFIEHLWMATCFWVFSCCQFVIETQPTGHRTWIERIKDFKKMSWNNLLNVICMFNLRRVSRGK